MIENKDFSFIILKHFKKKKLDTYFNFYFQLYNLKSTKIAFCNLYDIITLVII